MKNLFSYFRLSNLFLFGAFFGATLISIPWTFVFCTDVKIKLIVCMLPIVVLFWRMYSVWIRRKEINQLKKRKKWILQKVR